MFEAGCGERHRCSPARGRAVAPRLLPHPTCCRHAGMSSQHASRNRQPRPKNPAGASDGLGGRRHRRHPFIPYGGGRAQQRTLPSTSSQHASRNRQPRPKSPAGASDGLGGRRHRRPPPVRTGRARAAAHPPQRGIVPRAHVQHDRRRPRLRALPRAVVGGGAGGAHTPAREACQCWTHYMQGLNRGVHLTSRAALVVEPVPALVRAVVPR